MALPRLIPTLLLENDVLVKTKRFANSRYVGDPINIIRLFNDLSVDEIVLLDISKNREKTGPDFDLIEKMNSEAFMPLAYGGGIRNLEQMKILARLGVEKFILNTAIITDSKLVQDAVNLFGAQSVVASVDVKKSFLGQYKAYIHSGQTRSFDKLSEALVKIQSLGVGEVFVQSIDRDGTSEGFDRKILGEIPDQLSIPLVVAGGVQSIAEVIEIFENKFVSGVAAGSLFTFYGKRRAVLINYPNEAEITKMHHKILTFSRK